MDIFWLGYIPLLLMTIYLAYRFYKSRNNALVDKLEKSFGLGPKVLRVRISPGVPKFKGVVMNQNPMAVALQNKIFQGKKIPSGKVYNRKKLKKI